MSLGGHKGNDRFKAPVLKYAMPDAVQYHPVRLPNDFKAYGPRLHLIQSM